MSLQKGELGILRDSGITFIEKAENPPNAPQLQWVTKPLENLK